jgi:hypothetical protein
MAQGNRHPQRSQVFREQARSYTKSTEQPEDVRTRIYFLTNCLIFRQKKGCTRLHLFRRTANLAAS